MHFDLEVSAPARLEADVAIIGAGVAGLTAARRLLARGLSVILLESGGVDYEPDTAALNGGEVTGEPYYDLEDARLRLFGGTTAIWGGRCAELDPIDFEKRDWVPHSGWPISYAQLRAYYAEARSALGLQAVFSPAAPFPFDPKELVTPAWMFDDRFDRFTLPNCRDVADHPRCTVVTHATVREIKMLANGRAVERLDVCDLHGHAVDVRAGGYVLAAGGIENPRLLLASRSVCASGIGNGHDLVGRFFMEHPHARGGRIVGGAAWQLLRAFGKRRNSAGAPYAHLLAPSPDLQRRENLLNTSLTLAARKPAGGRDALLKRAYLHAKHRTNPTKAGRTLWKATKRSVRTIQRLTDPLRPWALHRLGRLDLTLVVRAEQAPNRDSRVRLGTRLDALGMPRVELDWRLSDLDRRSVAGLVDALRRETARLGVGQVETAEWLTHSNGVWVTDPQVSAHPIGGFHHLGTTRMADDPRQGVVDKDGRVHDVANLWIVGSSVFPTGGWANPTLTIVALALRTADRLAAAHLDEERSLTARFEGKGEPESVSTQSRAA